MTLPDFLNHLLNFVGPAAGVALLTAALSRIFIRKGPVTPAWWAQVAINLMSGSGVLLAGLWFFGADGRMATYGALVVVCGTVQWALLRGWRA